MQIAIDVAGFSAADADELRQAMGSKRSRERMNRLKGRFYDGMAKRRITGDVADQIWDKLEAFANFGFPESALGVVRLPRLHLGLAQVPLPGRVLRAAAERAADGVLGAAHARRRRTAPRRQACAASTSTLAKAEGDRSTRTVRFGSGIDYVRHDR